MFFGYTLYSFWSSLSEFSAFTTFLVIENSRCMPSDEQSNNKLQWSTLFQNPLEQANITVLISVPNLCKIECYVGVNVGVTRDDKPI